MNHSMDYKIRGFAVGIANSHQCYTVYNPAHEVLRVKLTIVTWRGLRQATRTGSVTKKFHFLSSVEAEQFANNFTRTPEVQIRIETLRILVLQLETKVFSTKSGRYINGKKTKMPYSPFLKHVNTPNFNSLQLSIESLQNFLAVPKYQNQNSFGKNIHQTVII